MNIKHRSAPWHALGRTVNQRFSPWRAIVEFLGARVRPETDPMEAAIDPVGKGCEQRRKAGLNRAA